MLDALQHPIYALPVELIQRIFECSVDTAEKALEQAMLLSSICRQWRLIAVDTPYLWKRIDIPSLPRLLLRGRVMFVQTLVPRSKSLPLEVDVDRITLLSPEKDQYPFWYPWLLKTLPKMESLTLRFSGRSAYDRFCQKSLAYPPYQPPTLRHLSIFTHLDFGGWFPVIDLTILCRAFHRLTQLTISKAERFETPTTALSSNLMHLQLQDIHHLNIFLIFNAFPRLAHLDLQDVRLERDTEDTEVEIRSIISLTLSGTGFFTSDAARRLKFPNLTLLCQSDLPSIRLVQFLSFHSSLKQAECLLEDEHFVFCASKAPWLTHVGISESIRPLTHWQEFKLAEPPFPNLEVLILGEDFAGMSYMEFESLVRGRLLPLHHPFSLIRDPQLHVKELRILLQDRKNWRSASWTKCELFEEARMDIVSHPKRDGWLYLSLRWN